MAVAFSGQPVFAAAATPTNSTLTEINNVGIIFAGICTSAPPTNNVADDCPCRSKGSCTLDDVLQLFVNLANFTLGISGSVLLFVFVYGGFKWVLSRGNPKWVEDGRAAMTGGIVGIVIIFGSYVAVNAIISGLKTGTISSTSIEQTLQGTPTCTDPKSTDCKGSASVPFTTN